MKLILALLLSGVAYTTASPACSESALEQCYSYDPRTENETFKESEEYLNSFCESAECMVDYMKKCGTSNVAPSMKGMLHQSEKIYKAVCNKQSSLRQKYLDTVKCLNGGMAGLRDSCKVRPDLEFNDPDYCQTVHKFIYCSNEVMRKDCGEDAYDVFTAISPDLVFYGCSE